MKIVLISEGPFFMIFGLDSDVTLVRITRLESCRDRMSIGEKAVFVYIGAVQGTERHKSQLGSNAVNAISVYHPCCVKR